MYDFTQDFTDYQKLVPNADLTVKPPSTVTTEPQGYDFNKDLEGYRKIAPDMSGLESVNDPLIKKAKLAQEKQQEEDKNKLKLAADLMITSGYSPDPEGVASAQITEGARKSLAGMQDRILGKNGVITQRFGNKNPIEKFSGGVNYGTDIGVDRGTKVSVPPGKWKVMEAYAGAEEGKEATNRGYGNSILVQNQETGEKMRFSHLSQVGVRPGEIVDGNKIVGATGSTGNSTGPHLDLEMYDRSGRLIDILNTPYSSYLGLGQGGGSKGEGGGNPMMDKITQVGRNVIGAVGNTPILPFIPQITPNRMASYKAPFEDQTQNIPQSVRNAFPITQIPEQIGSAVRQIGRFASLKPDAMDIATAPLMFMGGVKAKEIPTSALKKISTTDRQIMGDFVTAIENGEAKKILGNLGKDAENIAKALGIPETSTNKTIAKHFNDIIEAMDKKGIKPLLDKELPIKPSTGGEIGGTFKNAEDAFGGNKVLYHGTKADNLKSIAEKGLIVDGDSKSNIKKIYLSSDIKDSERFTSTHPNRKPLLLAVKDRVEYGPEISRGQRTDFMSTKTIPPEDIVVKTENGWQPLTDFYNKSVSGEIGGTTLYHGGSAKSFQDYQVGHGEYGTDRLTQHPIGIYTTEDKNIASKFGDVIQGKLAEGKKVLDLTNEKTVKDVWDKLGYKKDFVSPYDSLQPDTTMKHLGSQYKLVEDLINSNPEIKDKLIKDGYSGIRFVDRTGGTNHSTSVIFNPKDIVSGEIPKGRTK